MLNNKIKIALGFIMLGLGLISCNDSNTIILSGVSQENVNQIIVILGNNGINAVSQAQKDNTYSISTSASQKLNALNILQANGLPQKDFANFGSVFKKDSFISSPTEEHSRLLYALNQEVSNLLSALNGVTDVKTIVNVPEPSDDLWKYKAPEPSASVIIKYRQGERLDLYISKIKTLVANSVPGLSASKVEVVTLLQKDI